MARTTAPPIPKPKTIPLCIIVMGENTSNAATPTSAETIRPTTISQYLALRFKKR